MFARSLLVVGLFSMPALSEDKSKPLTPVEARKQVGKEITVKMAVKTAKDRLEKRGEIYLDAEEDFKDEKNFAVVITKKGAASLKEAGTADPADHFKGKTITAKGTVKEVDGVPRIEIDEAKQIAVADKKIHPRNFVMRSPTRLRDSSVFGGQCLQFVMSSVSACAELASTS